MIGKAVSDAEMAPTFNANANATHPLPDPPPEGEGDRAPYGVSRLGAELFTRYLVAVEAAGVLLFAALVGAAVIVTHGRPGGPGSVARSETGHNGSQSGPAPSGGSAHAS